MIGATLAHYRITGALGAGGMGEVYRARDVALKILPPEFLRYEHGGCYYPEVTTTA